MDEQRSVGRDDAPRSNHRASRDRAVILFDGACNLCDALVRWARRRDSKGRFRFAPLHSDEAAQLLALAGGRRAAAVPDSIVLVQGRTVHFRSSAVLRIARGLEFPCPLLAAGLLAPRPLRDAVYDWVARNRYRWFGGNASCPLPERAREERRRPPDHLDSDGRHRN